MQTAANSGATDTKEFVPAYIIEWSDSSCVWDVKPGHSQQLSSGPVAVQILPQQPLKFEFVAPAAALDSFHLMLATYRRDNTAHLWCELKDSSGQVITEAYIEPQTVRDNEYRRILDLREIAFNVGSKYTVELNAPFASHENGFGVWGHITEPGCYETPSRITRFLSDRWFLYGKHEGGGLAELKQLRSALVVIPEANGVIRIGAAQKALAAAFPDQKFEAVALTSPTEYWPLLSKANAVVFDDSCAALADRVSEFDALCFALHRRGICTIFFDAEIEAPDVVLETKLSRQAQRRAQLLKRCSYVLKGGVLTDSVTDNPLKASETNGASGALRALIQKYRKPRLPRVTIVSVLYRKSDVIATFLDHVVDQVYPGEIEVVLVDDCSPDGEIQIAQRRRERLAALGKKNRAIVTLSNSENLGNCASRIAGIDVATGDILIVIDCDCLLNRNFVAAHVFEHAWPDVDVVIGPLNIEAAARNASDLVVEFERDPQEMLKEAEPQDGVQPDGFLNCISRNFSIRRDFLPSEPLFDLDFSYSNRPDSGFGWEDVEMGYRLYKNKAVIRYTAAAFSVHVSHSSSVSEADKIRGSMRNFDRLFKKHPEMEVIARRWALDTYAKLKSWALQFGVNDTKEAQALDRRFAAALEPRRAWIESSRPSHRRLRVLTYRWHVPHQYELYKLPHDFTLVTGLGNPIADQWGFDQRPLRMNARMMPVEKVDPRDFDLAILHFDENVFNPNLCNGVIPAAWGAPFKWLLEIGELPKIAVCHGTPQFVGQYGLDPHRKTEFVIYDETRQRLVDALAAASAKVVCNSWQALNEWQFHDSRVIWHGFDPQEFPGATYERDVLALSPDRYRPHYRGAWELEEVRRHLDPAIRIETSRHGGAPLEPRDTNAFAVRNFRSYVDRIRQFKAYLNTTLRSPMPRARGEAMMTGVVPVCLNNHDVDRFIDPGKNGFYSNEPEELADFINFLCRDHDAALRIGANARRTALDLFNHDRYLAAWTALIDETMGKSAQQVHSRILVA